MFKTCVAVVGLSFCVFCPSASGDDLTIEDCQRRAVSLAQEMMSIQCDFSQNAYLRRMQIQQEISTLIKHVANLRLYHLQNEVPGEKVGDLYSRYQFRQQLNAAKTSADYYAISERLQKESFNLASVSVADVAIFGLLSQCRNVIMQMQTELVATAQARLSEDDFKAFSNAVIATNQSRNQMMSTILSSMNANSQIQSNYSTPTTSTRSNPSLSTKRRCSIHGMEYDIRFPTGCPACSQPDFGSGKTPTCPAHGCFLRNGICPQCRQF